MDDLADIIRNIPLFSALSREDIAKVLGKMEEGYHASGTTIFAQGDQGDAFFIIQSGAVQVVLQNGNRSEVIRVLGPQDWFGEMALLSGEPRSATIIAATNTITWRLSRRAWDELIEKHPIWLLHFCAALSKKLSYMEQQYSHGRQVFCVFAEEFYRSRSPGEQRWLRQMALLANPDIGTAEQVLQSAEAEGCLAALKKNHLALVRVNDSGQYELHSFFRDYLREMSAEHDGADGGRQLHQELSTRFETLGRWFEAVHHALEAHDWYRAVELLNRHKQSLVDDSAEFVITAINRLPHESIDIPLVHFYAEALVHLGQVEKAVAYYAGKLLEAARSEHESATAKRLRNSANNLLRNGDSAQALSLLRNALKLQEQESVSDLASIDEKFDPAGAGTIPELLQTLRTSSGRNYFRPVLGKSSFSRWVGAMLGLTVCGYLWFMTPDIGLEREATKQLGLLALTLIYWMFRVFPEYGVALLFALSMILSGLAKPESVLGGFSSTSWFMTLGVLGLGAAITGSGLFYRLSLQLVRVFPLRYYWQIMALGLMGVVVMALIPQQSARAAIISQMLMNLSESLGYKTPSRASTGFFVASFLGLGQLGFLFLTGSTTSLIAWGLLPAEVRGEFTWGYWFYAASVPTLVVVIIVLAATMLLYKPEAEARVSYKMVQTQLQILGPLSHREWITLAVLCLTIGGWLSISYHGIDGAWIALIALCILVNTGVLGWGMIKKGIDWEMLLYMGATLSIPSLLTQAKIDQWLVGMFAPLILPFTETPALCIAVIILITFTVKLAFTSFLTVVTLSVALLPLSGELGISPWVMAMVILIGSEVWFFPFQVDWHTMAYATTGGKGFSYSLMYRINPVYAIAYMAAAVVAIPWWRYLGLID